MNHPSSEFERAPHATRPGILAEYWMFLRYNRKWWLLPILLVLLLFGVLLLVSGGAAAPFIYTLF